MCGTHHSIISTCAGIGRDFERRLAEVMDGGDCPDKQGAAMP